MERKSKKIKNLRNFFDGSSFQQRALYYYLGEFFKDYSFVKVNYRNSSSGMEFDITIEFDVGETK